MENYCHRGHVDTGGDYCMDGHSVVSFLRYPSSALVDFALTLVNLTWQEALAIDMCGRKHMTQEAAAENAGYSVDAMQKWYRAGINKLIVEWSGHEWIKKVIS